MMALGRWICRQPVIDSGSKRCRLDWETSSSLPEQSPAICRNMPTRRGKHFAAIGDDNRQRRIVAELIGLSKVVERLLGLLNGQSKFLSSLRRDSVDSHLEHPAARFALGIAVLAHLSGFGQYRIGLR